MGADAVLVGKQALVTGAGRGIGRACALALAAAGANLAIAARSRPELDALAAEIEPLGVRALPVTCDVTDRAQVERMAAKALEALGTLDILVNNAGSAKSQPFLNHPDEIWHQMLAVNMTSTYYVTKAIVPEMVRRHSGRIINIASTAAHVGARYVAAYTASKHGVLGLTRTAAVEYARIPIRVNAVCPGVTQTPMVEQGVAKRPSMRQTFEKIHPMGRLGRAEEIGEAVAWLSSDAASFVTGIALPVDGGFTAI